MEQNGQEPLIQQLTSLDRLPRLREAQQGNCTHNGQTVKTQG